MLEPMRAEARRAAFIFSIGLAVLIAAATTGLVAYPGQKQWFEAFEVGGRVSFPFIYAYASLAIFVFWATAPDVLERRVAILSWPVVAFAMKQRYFGNVDMSQVILAGDIKALHWILASLALACVAPLLWGCFKRPVDPVARELVGRRRDLMLLTVMFAFVPSSALTMTAALHPQTWDLYALQFDRAAGISPIPTLVPWLKHSIVVDKILFLAYAYTPVAFLLVAALQVRRGGTPPISALLAWVGLSVSALGAYHLFPITGPVYVFSSDFLDVLRGVPDDVLKLLVVDNYPRNGMPSMHFGWMFTVAIIWCFSDTRWWTRVLMCLWAATVAASTQMLGEHYAIDLVVSPPFTLAILALCSVRRPWRGDRAAIIVIGLTTWLVWVVVLRTSVPWILHHAWVAKAMVVVTLAIGAWLLWRLRRLIVKTAPIELAPRQPMSPARRGALAMSAASGGASAVFLCVALKQLELAGADSARALVLVLAAALGAIAAGALIGARVLARSQSPARAHAMLEAGLAVLAVLTLPVLGVLQALAGDSGSVLLAAAVVLPTLLLLGARLPVLTASLTEPGTSHFARATSSLAVMTGASGVFILVAAYGLLPAIGQQRSLLLAGLIHLLAALVLMERDKRQRAAESSADTSSSIERVTPADRPAVEHRDWPLLSSGTAVLAGALAVGVVLVQGHLLSIAAGRSVQAYALMAASAAIGLAIGHEIARRWASRLPPLPGSALAWAGLGASLALASAHWNDLPEFFGAYMAYPLVHNFGAREAVRGTVCALMLMPAAAFAGMARVLSMRGASSPGGTATGIALNAAGGVVGALAVGLWLLPAFGGIVSAQVLTLIAVVAAVATALLILGGPEKAGLRPWRLPTLGASLAAGLLAWACGGWPLDPAQQGAAAHAFFVRQDWGRTIDSAERFGDGLSTVTVSVGERPVKQLLVNGRFRGNDQWTGENQTQTAFTLAALLHQDRRGSALAVGYGTGLTARILKDAGFQRLDLADADPSAVALADRHFQSLNRDVSRLPGVTMSDLSARGALRAASKAGAAYDLILIDEPALWFAGAADAFNREFYQLALRRLSAQGVLAQRISLSRQAPSELLAIIATLRESFPQVSLYALGSQGLLVATADRERALPMTAALARLERESTLAPVLAALGRSPLTLPNDRLLGPAGVDVFLHDTGLPPVFWASTDDNLHLEFGTPRGNVLDADESLKGNLKVLERYRGVQGASREETR